MGQSDQHGQGINEVRKLLFDYFQVEFMHMATEAPLRRQKKRATAY